MMIHQYQPGNEIGVPGPVTMSDCKLDEVNLIPISVINFLASGLVSICG